jgi:hypothetical protein
MIGSLLYLTTSRYDIMQDIGLVGRFQSNPRKLMFLQSKVYSGTCKELLIMDCGIQKTYTSFSELIQMQIGQKVLMIEKTLVEVHSSLAVV